MAGVLIGQDAVDELERQLGRTPTDIERQIAMEEGYRPTVGKDIDGRAIIGFGQTGDFKNQTLDKVANIFEKRTERLIPNYNMLPDFVRNRAFDATYRGTLGQSPMTVDLMNAGQYGDAADEFLDNQEYRDAVLSGSGVAARMERTADAFRVYGNQDTKQVVPEMNKVDPRLLYEQRLAEAKQAQQKADLNRLQSVPPVDMNGGQVDPRGFTQNANKPKYAQLSGAGPAFNQLYNNLQPNNSSQAKPQGAPSYTTNYGSSVSPVTRPNSFLSPAAQAAIAQTQSDPRNRTTNRSNLIPATSPVPIDGRYRTANRSSVPQIDQGYQKLIEAKQAATQKNAVSAVPVDPRGDKLLGEMGIVPPNKVDSDKDKMAIARATNKIAIADTMEERAKVDALYNAYADPLIAQGFNPLTRAQWDDDRNRKRFGFIESQRVNQRQMASQNSYTNYIKNGGDPEITLEEWDKFSQRRKVKAMTDVLSAKSVAAGAQPTINSGRFSNVNKKATELLAAPITVEKVVPELEGANNDNFEKDSGFGDVTIVPELKDLPLNAIEAYSAQLAAGAANSKTDTKPTPTDTAEDDTSVPTLGNKLPVPDAVKKKEPVPVLADDDPSNTNAPDDSAFGPDGSLKDGEGKEVVQTKEEKERNKGIFDKASELFGDVLSAADLRRMTLYTIGGLLSGGSLEGSFQWAGMKVMQEQGEAKIAQAKLDEKALENKNIVAREDTKAKALLKSQGKSADALLAAQQQSDDAALEAALVSAKAARDRYEWDNENRILAADVLAKRTAAIARLTAEGKDKTGQPTGEKKYFQIESKVLNGKGIDSFTAERYYIDNNAQGWRVKNPYAGQEGHGNYIPQDVYEAWVAQYDGSIALGRPELPSVTAKAEAKDVTSFIDSSIIPQMEKEYKRLELDYNANLAASVTPFFLDHQYTVGNTLVQSTIRQAVGLATTKALKHEKFSGEKVNDISPYLQTMLLSTVAGAPGAGVWAIEQGDSSKGAVDVAKTAVLGNKLMELNDGNWNKAAGAFKVFHTQYKKQLEDGEYDTSKVKLNTGENHFYVWLHKALKIN